MINLCVLFFFHGQCYTPCKIASLEESLLFCKKGKGGEREQEEAEKGWGWGDEKEEEEEKGTEIKTH